MKHFSVKLFAALMLTLCAVPASAQFNLGKAVNAAAKTAKAAPAATGVTYAVGDTVRHKTFGTGVVLSTQPMGNDTLLEVAFDRAGTKKLMANFARMEKV